MATENLGTLAVILGVDTRQYERDLKKSRNDLERFSTQATAISKGITKVGRGLMKAVTLPAVAAAAFSLNEYRKFNQAMTESLAIMGDVSKDTRKEMEELALTLSTKMTFSAEKAARAYFFLASAGFSVQESMGALPIVMKFAQAGMFTLEHATSLLADSTKALGLWTGSATENQRQMARVSDVLVKANTLANATTEQFAAALTNRYAAALRTVNKDVEEGAAVLAAFAEQGRKGEKAGLAASIVLRDLQRAALKNADTFKKMNIEVFNAQGELNNIADILEDIEVRFDGMTAAQRKATLMMLGFQERSQLNLLNLIGMSERIREFEKELRNAAGTTDEVANEQLESLQAQLALIWNRIKKVSIAFARTMLPAVEKIMKKVEDFVKWLEELSTEQKEMVVYITAIAAAIAPLLIALGGVLTMLGSVAAGLGALVAGGGSTLAIVTLLSASIVVLLPLLTLFTAGMAVAVMAVVEYKTTLDGTSEAVDEFKDQMNFSKEVNEIIKLGEEIDNLDKKMKKLATKSGVPEKREELRKAELWLEGEKEKLEIYKKYHEQSGRGETLPVQEQLARETMLVVKQEKRVKTLRKELKMMTTESLEYQRLELQKAKALMVQEGQRVKRMQNVRRIQASLGKLTKEDEYGRKIQNAIENYLKQKKSVEELAAAVAKLEKAQAEENKRLEERNNLQLAQEKIQEILGPLKHGVVQELDPFAAAMIDLDKQEQEMVQRLQTLQDTMADLIPGGATERAIQYAIKQVRHFIEIRRKLLEDEQRKEIADFVRTEDQKRLIRLKEERDQLVNKAKNAKQKAAIEKAYTRKRKQLLIDMVKNAMSEVSIPSISASVEGVEKGTQADYRARHGLDNKELEVQRKNERNTAAIKALLKKLKGLVSERELKMLHIK